MEQKRSLCNSDSESKLFCNEDEWMNNNWRGKFGLEEEGYDVDAGS